MKKNVSIMIKPASSMCNLRCEYCFYHDVAKNRETSNFGMMSHSTAKNIIEKTLDFADGGKVNFLFQGGEPLLWGLENFKDFVELSHSANSRGSKISYGLQTNGTLIDDDFCKFFKANNFLIGISIDGKGDLHNLNRKTAEGKGTFTKVMSAVDLIKKYNVDFNILAVITKQSAKSARSIYSFFKKQGWNHMQFIPCLDDFLCRDSAAAFSLTEEEYFDFHRDLFDLYVEDKKKGEEVYIRYFDNLLPAILGQGTPELCGMSGYCPGQLVIEGNGNAYPCDFYCEDKYLLGNINDMDLFDFAKSENMKTFVISSTTIDEKCSLCEVYSLCKGGCRRERDIFRDGELQLNVFCEGKRKLFSHMISCFRGQEVRK